MSIPTYTSPATQRLKGAVFGFAITTVLLAAIAGGQFLFARHTVREVGVMNPDVDIWAVSQFRSALLPFYATVVCFLATYWLLTGIMSRGQFLRIKSANVTLAFAGLTFAFAMVVASAVPAPTRFLELACPYLGFSETHSTFGFDTRSACEAFASAAVPRLLLGLPALLLATSAILRILVSRYRLR